MKFEEQLTAAWSVEITGYLVSGSVSDMPEVKDQGKMSLILEDRSSRIQKSRVYRVPTRA